MITKSFFQAFKDRYLDTGDLDLNELTIKQKYTKDLVVELVGREKVIDTFKNLKNLKQIVLTDCSIKYANDKNTSTNDEKNTDEELKLNLRSNRGIKSLDISYNQIDSWTEIVKIVELFPFIEELIITCNPFQSITLDNLELQIQIFKQVKNLIAGKLTIDWSTIELFDKLFVNLKSLNIFGNQLGDLQLSEFLKFANVEYLSFSENQMNWSDVLKLKRFVNLKYLQLDSCQIEEIRFNNPNEFKNIKQLNLNNNRINKWSHISELSKLTNLTELSVRENPLFKDQDHDQVFNFTLAILKKLKVLNKQIITNDKRKEAEIYFLRIKYKAWLNGELKEWNVQQRFEELIEYYGKPVDLLKDFEKNKFLYINLTDGQKLLKIKVPISMKISALKMLVKNRFNLYCQDDFELWYLSDDKKSLKYELEDKEGKNLESYSIDDNSTIEIRR